MKLTIYRLLCGLLGAGLVLSGLALFLGFFQAMMPDGEMAGPLSPIGPNGLYFVAFTGTALVGWGGCLFGAVRSPEANRTVGTATAVALVLSAVYRLFAWLMGDYSQLGELPRIESAIFLILALCFVWLRPPVASTRAASTPAAA